MPIPTLLVIFINSFNQCLSTWAEKTSYFVDIYRMLRGTNCTNQTVFPTVGPWCQDSAQGCYDARYTPS